MVMTLKALFREYMRSADFKRLKGTTQKKYEQQLAYALKTRVGRKHLAQHTLDEIKASTMNIAYEQWVETGVYNANYRKAAFSAAWKYGMRRDYMVHNPCSLIRGVTSKPRRVRWTREQVRKFLDTAYSDFQYRSIGLIVHMAYDWGQRVGDMRLMTWDKLDLDTCRLDLTQSKRNAEVHLPINKGLCKMLREQKQDFEFQEYVAPRIKPRAGAYTPYEVDEISKLINSVLSKANLPLELTAMDLRRTAITEMLEGGVDMFGIMQVSGHVNPQSVKPYMVNTFSGASKALAARGNNDDE
jgi:integrase